MRIEGETMAEMKHGKEQKSGKKKWIILLILLLLLAGGAGWYLLKSGGLTMDPQQSEGTLDGMSEAEIREMLERKVEEGSLMISINSRPEFPDGESKGTLRIENSPQNRYLLIVKIYLRETDGSDGELIYESGAIKPGNKIEEAKLDKALKKGTYPVTAYFEGYDIDTQSYIGKAASQLEIEVRE